MLGAEVVKIISSRYEQTIVYVLTLNNKKLNYKHLNKDLEDKWFGGSPSKVHIQHFLDFLQDDLEKTQQHLSQKQKEDILNVLKKQDFCKGGEEFQSILIGICEALNNSQKKFIIMLDEVSLNLTCKKTTEKNKETYAVNFSYLEHFTNVHIVLCMNPSGYIVKNFNLTYPKRNKQQHYHVLKSRYRNTRPILEFLREFQKNDPDRRFNGYPSIQYEKVLKKESLPPVLDPPGYGVIWIPCGFGNDAEEKTLQEVRKVLLDLKDEQASVSILYHDPLEGKSNSKILAQKLFNGTTLKSWRGPHGALGFNGAESSVIVYFVDGYLDIQAMSRARQLLIIVSHGLYLNHPTHHHVLFKPMKKFVEKGHVKKLDFR